MTPAPVTSVELAGEAPGEAVHGEGVDVLAVPVASRPTPDADGTPRVEPGPGTAEVLARHGIDLATLVRVERLRARVGEVTRVPLLVSDDPTRRLLLVGMGAGTPADLRRAAAALARVVRGRAGLATTLGAGGTAEHTRAVVEGLVLGGYQPPSAGLRPRTDSAPVPRVVLFGRHSPEALRQGVVHAAATVRARDLASWPANVKNPRWMVERAQEVAEAEGLRIEVWDGGRLRHEGFGGLVAVGAGSVHEPRMVRLDHRPDGGGAPDQRPVVLVGKGITFDTGGLSIKNRESMVTMRTDMTGSAVVLAVLEACRRLDVGRPVVGLLPLAENAVGGASFRPSDVVRIRGGRTVEVTNTDAEGRLVLADALAYADEVLDPVAVVDVATLTGAATLGLGRRHAALYSTAGELTRGLRDAGASCGEQVWPMPLEEDYRSCLDSSVADLRQVSGEPRLGGGSITAALFLREFVGGRPWAHLDIAGTARSDKDEHEVNRGATGWGARLLLRWVESLGTVADPLG
jgi:leucyl aminopeptidase